MGYGNVASCLKQPLLELVTEKVRSWNVVSAETPSPRLTFLSSRLHFSECDIQAIRVHYPDAASVFCGFRAFSDGCGDDRLCCSCWNPGSRFLCASVYCSLLYHLSMSFGNIWLHSVLLERRGFLQKVASCPRQQAITQVFEAMPCFLNSEETATICRLSRYANVCGIVPLCLSSLPNVITRCYGRLSCLFLRLPLVVRLLRDLTACEDSELIEAGQKRIEI